MYDFCLNTSASGSYLQTHFHVILNTRKGHYFLPKSAQAILYNQKILRILLYFAVVNIRCIESIYVGNCIQPCEFTINSNKCGIINRFFDVGKSFFKIWEKEKPSLPYLTNSKLVLTQATNTQVYLLVLISSMIFFHLENRSIQGRKKVFPIKKRKCAFWGYIP